MTENTTRENGEASLWQTTALESDPFDTALDDLHGLQEEVNKLRETYIAGLVEENAPVRLPSLLLYGPPNAGQTRVGRAVASELAAHDFDCARITGETTTPNDPHRKARSDQQLAAFLDELQEHAPVTLLIEDLQELHFHDESAFRKSIRRLRDDHARVAVVCVLDQTDPRFNPNNAPGYFEFADLLIEIAMPGRQRCAHLLKEKLTAFTAGTSLTLDTDLEVALAEATAEFEVTNLAHIARRAVLLARADSGTTATITNEYVTAAVEQVTDERTSSKSPPRQRGEVPDRFQPEVPDVSFDDIGGLDAVIKRCRELLTYPQKYEDIYSGTLSPSNGVLLHGPPGTGKTLLAKALANEANRTFYAVEGAAVKSKWFGESERRMRQLFETAREDAPSLVFFDEFDALAATRDTTNSAMQSIVNTLLSELDGMSKDSEMLVVAATNRPAAIDSAVLRPGRLGESVEVPPPDEHGQREIFRIHTDQIPTATDVTPAWFVATVPDQTTGADISAVVERAAHQAVRRGDDSGESVPTVTRSDFRTAIDAVLDIETRSSPGFQ